MQVISPYGKRDRFVTHRSNEIANYNENSKNRLRLRAPPSALRDVQTRNSSLWPASCRNQR